MATSPYGHNTYLEGEGMNCERFVRQSAAFWLAVIGLFCLPLETLASGPDSNEEQTRALQDEVLAQWAKNESPIDEVIFRG